MAWSFDFTEVLLLGLILVTLAADWVSKEAAESRTAPAGRYESLMQPGARYATEDLRAFRYKSFDQLPSKSGPLHGLMKADGRQVGAQGATRWQSMHR